MNESEQDLVERALTESWETIVRRSAAATTRRVAQALQREERWNRRLARCNRIALAVGLLTLVQFPVMYAVFAALEKSALEFCVVL